MYTELSKGTIEQTETMVCSDSTANTLELCKQDNAINTTYVPIGQISVQLKQMLLSG